MTANETTLAPPSITVATAEEMGTAAAPVAPATEKPALVISDATAGTASLELKIPSKSVKPVKPAKPAPRMIDQHDLNRLKVAGYMEASEKYDTAYVILHHKTGKIAELWAASSIHACTMLGWNPKRVTLLRSRKREKPLPVAPVLMTDGGLISTVEAATVEAATVEAATVEAAPVEAAPVEAAPVEAAPVEAATELPEPPPV